MCKKSKCKTCGFTECEEHPGTITLTPEDVDRLATEKSVITFFGYEEYIKNGKNEWVLDSILVPVKELGVSIRVKTTGETSVIYWASRE